MANAPAAVLQLVETFAKHESDYRSPAYKEARLRIGFIDPLFEALGWDVRNREDRAEAYRDVIYEDTVRVDGRIENPDYTFRAGQMRKFFVEAKKPSVDLMKDSDAAFQLRRYGWSGKVPLSILTNFAHLVVYDTRRRPQKGDNTSRARINIIPFQELPDRWEEIESLFSRDAVYQGAFDKYAEDAGRMRGTAAVDKAFLADIDEWRGLLAGNILLRNPGLSADQLNTSVQQIIDRIVFLRICEDRRIEPTDRLRDAASGDGVFAALMQLFRRADDRYNSGLFHFQQEQDRQAPDRLTPVLVIDDEPLKTIINKLYYPESSYAFNVIGADILGAAYERVLGKVVVVGGGAKRPRVSIQDKPEVRKAGGVFYTPAPIVSFIVEQTLGETLKGMTVESASRVKVVDPSCGSGSFLVAAYEFLMGWHLEQYAADPEKWSRRKNPRVFEHRKGWRLTAGERKRILTQSIYGVDLDEQAVEVAQLSLLLKVLEGETEDTLRQYELIQERILPDLVDNVTVGNSLIGYDFRGSSDEVDHEEWARIKPFDWREAFSTVFKNGGFDVIVGNPPYLNLKRGFLTESELQYFRRHYKAAEGQYDSFVLFTERSLTLLKRGGRLGFILPKPVLVSESYEPLRKLLFEQTIEHIAACGAPFEDADVEAATLVIQRRRGTDSNPVLRTRLEGTREPASIGEGSVSQGTLRRSPFTGLSYLMTDRGAGVVAGLDQWPRLADLCSTFTRGIEAGKNALVDVRKTKAFMPTLRGEDVTASAIDFSGTYYEATDENAKKWKASSLYEVPEKVLVRRVANFPMAAVDGEGFWVLNTLYIIHPVPGVPCAYIAACLNSRVLRWLTRVQFLTDDELFPYLRVSQLSMLPVPDPREADANLVKSVGSLQHDLAQALADVRSASSERGATVARRKITMLTERLESVVCGLYGVDVALVEELASEAGL